MNRTERVEYIHAFIMYHLDRLYNGRSGAAYDTMHPCKQYFIDGELVFTLSDVPDINPKYLEPLAYSYFLAMSHEKEFEDDS